MTLQGTIARAIAESRAKQQFGDAINWEAVKSVPPNDCDELDAKAVIDAIAAQGLCVINTRKLRSELNHSIQQIGAIRIPSNNDETLACTICDYAENPDQEVCDDYGRTPDALDALDAFDASIADLFEPVKAMVKAGEANGRILPRLNLGVSDMEWCCHKCLSDKEGILSVMMILCPKCGNKRCPKATNHRNDCTASNEPGQKGSVYE